MPFYRINGMLVHLKLSGRKPHPAPCCARISLNGIDARCFAPSTALCDWPLDCGGTCDAPLCPEHATATGPNEHLCPVHLARRREVLPGLFD